MPKTRERILVTGGAGFIGSHVVEGLLKAGYPVRVLDNFSTGLPRNLQGVTDQVEVLDGDLRSPADVEEALQGVGRVVHLGALPSVPLSIEAPLDVHAANVDGTLNLLEAAARQKVKRFVLAGSASVYGNGPAAPCRETIPAAPLSPYGVTQAAAEQLGLLFHRERRLPVVCLRLFNVYGPRQDPSSPHAAVVPRFMQAVLRGEPFPMFGDGKQKRDFTYIDDLVRAIQAALTKGPAVGKVINIGTGRPVSLLELARMIAKVAGTKCRLKFLPPRPGDPSRCHADIRFAERTLGYRPRIGLEEGLKRTFEWYRESLGT